MCSASPSSQSAKLRDHLSERGPVTLGKRLVTLRMAVGGETQFAGPCRWSRRILGAGCLVGEQFMLMSATDTRCRPYLISTWVASSLKQSFLKIWGEERMHSFS